MKRCNRCGAEFDPTNPDIPDSHQREVDEMLSRQIVIEAKNVIVPKTSHHAKKVVKIGHFTKLADKPELVGTKEFWRHHFNTSPSKPAAPLTGPLRLDVVVVWPYRKSERASIVKSGREVWHTTKPDRSNVQKTLEDMLQECGYFENDSQLCDGSFSKLWGPVGRFVITLQRLTD